MSFRKRLEVVPLEKVKDTLAEKRGNQTDMVPKVKILEKRNAFAGIVRPCGLAFSFQEKPRDIADYSQLIFGVTLF
jgi:hypothetical protein